MNVIVPVGATPMLSAVRVTVKETGDVKWLYCVLRAVTAGVTVNGYAALVLAWKLASPGKDAVRLVVPPGIKEFCNSAMPSLASGAVPSVLLPLLKVIVPVAAPFGFAAGALLP